MGAQLLRRLLFTWDVGLLVQSQPPLLGMYVHTCLCAQGVFAV